MVLTPLSVAESPPRPRPSRPRARRPPAGRREIGASRPIRRRRSDIVILGPGRLGPAPGRPDACNPRNPVSSRARRGRVSRRGRERHVRVGLLVAVAVVISAVLMGGLTAQAVMARTNCSNHPLVVNVAVSEDIAPAVQRVGQLFNRQDHVADGRCAVAEITPADPATVASVVDGQASSGGLPAEDAWIPDSSLWVDVARSYPLGAQQVQTTGITVARSPLMIVMPPAAAAQVPAFNNTVGWSFLAPASAGGPPAAQKVSVELPDPTQSAAGLAALIEVSRLLGAGAAARTQLTKFVVTAQSSAQFDNPASLAAFVSLSAPPLDAHPVTVASE